MMKKLLIFSSVRWDFMWQRHQALALAASQDGWAVDFVEPPVRGPAHMGSALYARARTSPEPIVNPVPAGVKIATLPKSFWARTRSGQLRILSRVVSGPYDLAVLYMPMLSFVDFAEASSEQRVYDQVIDWGQAPRSWFPPSGWEVAESRTVEYGWKQATDSERLADRHKTAGRPCLVLPPAADDAFAAGKWSAPEKGTPVLYFGSVRRSEIDVALLTRLAEAGIPVRVIGPVDRDSQAALSVAGVDLLQPVTPSELPKLINKASNLLLPYHGARSETLVPAKLWNCLSTNRSVFVRGLTLTGHAGQLTVRLPDDDSLAVEALRAAVANPASRPPTTETWDRRWSQLLAHSFS